MRKVFRERLDELGYATYRDYTRSAEWQATKLAYRHSGLPTWCLVCRCPKYQLHHRSYARLGKELMMDFIPLCGDCHRKVHEFEKMTGIPLEATHKIIRLAFGLTRRRVRQLFEPFCRPDAGESFQWVPNGKPPKKRKAKDRGKLPMRCSKKGRIKPETYNICRGRDVPPAPRIDGKAKAPATSTPPLRRRVRG